jgi:DNA repair protein RadD
MSEVSLRDYQRDGLRGVREVLDSGKGPPVLHLGTGAGKTVAAAAAAKATLGRRQRFGFMVPYIGLVDQTGEKFEPWIGSGAIGVIQANHKWYRPEAPCQIISACTIDARRRKGEPFPDLDVVFVDECHIVHEVVPQWMREKPGTKFVGLSATPYTPGLGSIYTGGLVRPIDLQGLIDAKQLVDFEAFAPSGPDLAGVRISRANGDFNPEDTFQRMTKADLFGSIIDEWEKRAGGVPTVCFCVGVKHAEFMSDAFNAAGIAAEWAFADTPPDERKAIGERLRAGETKVVANCEIFTIGTDWPWLECAILARPTKSPAKFVQMVGRVLRPYEDKERGYVKKRALILDHSDNHHRLGKVTDIDRENTTLCDGSKASRSARKEKEKTELGVKCCPQCSHIVATTVKTCPPCGYTWPVRVNVATHDAELVAFGSGTRGKVKASPRGKAYLQGLPRKDVYAQLLWIARDRKHKDSWAYHNYCEIFDIEKVVIVDGRKVWTRVNMSKSRMVPPCYELSSWLRSRQIANAHRNGGGHA